MQLNLTWREPPGAGMVLIPEGSTTLAVSLRFEAYDEVAAAECAPFVRARASMTLQSRDGALDENVPIMLHGWGRGTWSGTARLAAPRLLRPVPDAPKEGGTAGTTSAETAQVELRAEAGKIDVSLLLATEQRTSAQVVATAKALADIRRGDR